MYRVVDFAEMDVGGFEETGKHRPLCRKRIALWVVLVVVRLAPAFMDERIEGAAELIGSRLCVVAFL